jgi:hypothetical protein
LRASACAVRVRPSRLQYLGDVGEPHAGTLKKLEDWYLRLVETEGPVAAGDMERVALGVLVRGLPVHRRDEAIQRSLIFCDLYLSLGTTPPDWVANPDNGE